MKTIDRGFLAAIVLGVLAIAAAFVGESSKLAWMSDWLSPFLLLLFLITLGSVGGRRMHGANASPTPTSPVRQWLRSATVVTPIWCFLSIEMVGDASVDMRLFGLTWSMGAHEASRLLAVGGFFLGAIVVGLSWRDSHRNRKEVAGD
jgi:TRAP-type C4-dicarboxylate transport system permease small subunit